ncbi:ATP-binding protein [Lignipirellula cremea]|uniref:histidine kinase n=1 Tax=Lignipirellula cremea TaxID=2528010 RepID=A0A518DM38_9BACT|nr:ATP-binding protein [Lignipirellula cremea]QDU92891.1 Sensor kinase CusS [Lignipirellula cremea]
MMRSLQMRLLVGLAAGVSLVLVTAGVVLYLLIRAELVAEFDATLASEAHALATLVEEKDGRLTTEMAEHGVSKFQPQGRPIHYAVWDSQGRQVERSSALGPADLPSFGGTLSQPQFRAVRLPGSLPGRMVGFQFIPHHEAEEPLSGSAASRSGNTTPRNTTPVDTDSRVQVTLVAARDTVSLDYTLRRIGMLLAGVFGGAVLASLLAAAPIVRASLRPLERISARIQSLDPQALTPVDAADAPDEVRAVVDRLNDLLDRLHAAFQRERAFSANVAHELRTPLAGLRSTLEVALTRPREAGEYRRSLQQCLAICLQAESLTGNLLVLARLDARQVQPQHESVPLSDLLHACWTMLAPAAEARGLLPDWQTPAGLTVQSDPALLSLILRNLLDNAVSYADADSTIVIRSSEQQGRVKITVQNAAARLPADLQEHACDRFWRADTARSGGGQHAGLGLALCRETAEVLGGKLWIQAEADDFAASLELPAPGQAPFRSGRDARP